ncbi:glutamyl-tRNA reductase [Myroides odoratimimus]|uniref:Glutamyl-tRNA reductase n=3 Tax=Myroides odoratimimus TaxID=76832 RepID=A0A0S7EEG8_9FLAO|nr:MULTISPECIES: glutamyl-tRNA reductase [Myroides]AJA68122.1 glutamyl-tRNA reductase [Myroides sp. A21]ALU25432.1 glutamyl-tRNA reductase [Myroides odoratimimus]EHO05162.1 glutamyl-tRNA reductase [Myroides odoratimimus CCUG 12901]EHO05626.1 glutamyl-tRNA reductase [Myroides odoratimimus CIP 101113]EHO06787.1 glutamyl-tRNA reductase [Myroides odoratimimus CCUG 10230]
MDKIDKTKPATFYAVGLSYKKADAEMRGKFSLSDEAKDNLLTQAKNEGIESLIVISTCNRTEIFGFAQHPFELIKLLCDNSNGTVDDFRNVAYVYKTKEAIEHLFRVGTGLDSQILGDFEIISQIKNAFYLAKEKELTTNYFERLVNAVIQASKRIKNETELSSGATSVSFASVQYIMDHVEDISNKNILLFGTGKIGRNTCENLVKHTKNDHITLINRTKEKALEVAGKFNLIVKDYADLQAEIRKSDVLIVATGAQKPTVDKALLNLTKPLVILDLSIPKNVSDDVTEIEGVELIHLDYLSQMTDKTIERRREFIPQAEEIIEEIMSEFIAWTKMRKFAPTIHALKSKLEQIKDGELDYHKKKYDNFDSEQAELISMRIIQKITTHFANHLRHEDTVVDQSIEWIEKVFHIESN